MLGDLWGEDDGQDSDETTLEILATRVEAINKQLQRGGRSQSGLQQVIKHQRRIAKKLEQQTSNDEILDELQDLRELLLSSIVVYHEEVESLQDDQKMLSDRLEQLESRLEDEL